MVTITLETKGKPTINLDFTEKHPNNITVAQVKDAIHTKFKKFVPNRQRLTFPDKLDARGKPIALVDDQKSLSDYGVGEGGRLRLKDLGAQTSYRNLYLWEYAGVPILNPLLLYLSPLIHGQYTPSALQTTVRNLIVLHFIKRFLESAFVHSFSRATVPRSYVYRNVAYYWGIVGLLIGLTLYRPAYSAEALKGSILDNPNWIKFWSVFIVITELLNLYAHVHLATLRQPPGQPRKFPTGWGFGVAVCANYWYEVLGLVGLIAITGGDIGTIIYAIIGTYFMAIWSAGKYKRYKREFDPKVFPGKRYKMFPPLY